MAHRGIISARDREVHGRMRKAMSYTFNTKALRDQEVVVYQYVGLFVQQPTKLGGAGKQAVDDSEAFDWLTFGIIGLLAASSTAITVLTYSARNLAFGEPFNAAVEGKTHF